MDVLIEVERESDAAAIHDVVARAFAHQAGVAEMVDAIRASDRYRPGLAFVARAGDCARAGDRPGDSVVGFVMLSGTDLVGEAGTRREVLTLTPLAVAPEYERRGIGSALVRHAVAEADQRGEPLVVLEGSPVYYGRLGFRPAAAHGITLDLPDWAPPEAAQVFLLAAYDPVISGHIRYPPAIAALSS